jgi:hypothetical protein
MSAISLDHARQRTAAQIIVQGKWGRYAEARLKTKRRSIPSYKISVRKTYLIAIQPIVAFQSSQYGGDATEDKKEDPTRVLP